MSASGLKLTTRTEAEARAQIAAAAEQLTRTTLDDHCDHANLNAHGTRCLSCGLWLRTDAMARGVKS